jgi:transcriptional regulator with GAF, ATPase, and Fis domain
MAVPSENLDAGGVQAVRDAGPVTTRNDPLAFERLISEISATFVAVPAEALDARIEGAMGRFAEFLDADRATLAQRAPEDRQLLVTHQWVRPGVGRTPMWDVNRDLPWLAARLSRGESVVARSIHDFPPEAVKERAAMERFTRAILIVPLLVAGKLVGALAFGATRGERDWSPEIVDRLRLVADVLANALARKETDLALRQALECERLICALAARLIDVSADTIDEQIRWVVRGIGEFLDLDRVAVLGRVPDERAFWRTHQWVREGISTVDGPEPEDAYPWALERLVGHREPLVVSDPDDLPPQAHRERNVLTERGIRSIAIVPIEGRGEVTGVVTFAAVRRPRSWPGDLVQRLRLFGDVVGTALERAREDQALRQSLAENEKLRQQLEAENVYLRAEVHDAHDFREIVGQSTAIRAVLHKIDQVAATDTAVLLLGETGTGKELFARAIHARSRRSVRALIAVNCAALPATLVESELFGHEKGAFTGAAQAKPGRFELADGGTLFLDEIGDLDVALQAKLLRALQDGEIQRLGATRTRRVDVRVVAATNRNLEPLLREGRFRADLYYRLSVFPVEVPPLRERPDDIPLLVWHFIQSRQRSFGRTIKRVPRAAMDTLQAYDWPGNVRELQNVIERSLILSSGSTLRLEEAFRVPMPRATPAPTTEVRSDGDTLDETERVHIVRMLERSHWRIEGRRQAAERLGLKPSTLRYRMKKLGIRRPPAD